MKGFFIDLFEHSLSLQILLLWSALSFVLGAKQGFFCLPPAMDRKKIPVASLSLFLVFLLFISTSLFLPPFFTALLKEYVPPLQNESLLFFLHSLLQVGVTFLLILLFCFSYQKQTLLFFFYPPIPSSSFGKNALISFIAWWMAFPTISLVDELLTKITLFLFQLPQLPNQSAIEFLRASLHSPFFFSFAVLMIIAIAPVMEEILFRGYLHNWLKKMLGRQAAIMGSSMAFALFHFSFAQKANNIPIICSLFLLGLFLSYLYERQNSLSAPILLHAYFNLTNVLNFIYLQGA